MRSHNITYFARLDALRFIAALMVLMFHTMIPHFNSMASDNILWNCIKEGSRGVNLFFVLSGFLFAMIGGRQEKIIYKSFILNRCLRIFPLLIFIFFVSTSIFRSKLHSDQILGLLFLQFYLEEFRVIMPMGACWTISIEFAFYLIFPFLHHFTNRYGERYLMSLIGLFVLMRFLSYPVNQDELVYYFSILGRFDVLLTGMLFGRIYLRKPNLFRNAYTLPLMLLFVVAYVNLVQQLLHTVWYLALYPPIEAAVWGLLIMISLNSTLNFPRFESLLAKLGGISYSMYLLHIMIVHYCEHIHWLDDPILNSLLVCFALILPMTIGLANLTFYTIERPFLEFRSRYVVPAVV
jgi:peptidoglycan/LPS O-acetylase OafA/YrhL